MSKDCNNPILKPGSDIPGTYHQHSQEHCDGICAHLSPNHNLSQALTDSLPEKLGRVQLHRQASGCLQLSVIKIFYVKIICRHNVWCTSNNSIFPLILFSQMKWLKIAPIQFAFCANLSTFTIHHRCVGYPPEQIAERCQL